MIQLNIFGIFLCTKRYLVYYLTSKISFPLFLATVEILRILKWNKCIRVTGQVQKKASCQILKQHTIYHVYYLDKPK